MPRPPGLQVQVPRNKIVTKLALRYGFLMYSEFRRNVMQSMISSSDWVDETICGKLDMIKLKFPAMSSKKYSGKHFTCSGSCSGNGKPNFSFGNLPCADTRRSIQTVTNR